MSASQFPPAALTPDVLVTEFFAAAAYAACTCNLTKAHLDAALHYAADLEDAHDLALVAGLPNDVADEVIRPMLAAVAFADAYHLSLPNLLDAYDRWTRHNAYTEDLPCSPTNPKTFGEVLGFAVGF